MRWFYDPGYDYGSRLPGGPREIHGFVLRKPSEIHDALVAMCVVVPGAFRSPEPVAAEELRFVHSERVVQGLSDPWSVATAIELPEIAALPPEVIRDNIVAPQLLAAGGTCEALACAAVGESATNLSGGFHHARRDLSHGFCLINDVALAVARLRRARQRRRVLILDLDLHQGDGNATCFAQDDSVFTVSLHQEDIFPYPKMTSDIDVGLAAGTGDDAYLAALESALGAARARFRPDIVVYVAGSDPYENDRLGDLRLTRAGLLQRDRRIGEFTRDLRVPIVALPAGGYTDESPAINAAGFAAIAAAVG